MSNYMIIGSGLDFGLARPINWILPSNPGAVDGVTDLKYQAAIWFNAGTIQFFDGTNIKTLESSSFTLHPADASNIGGVRVAGGTTGIKISTDAGDAGTISLMPASSSHLGGVSIPTGSAISITALGEVDVVKSSASVYGVVRPDNVTLEIDGSGNLAVKGTGLNDATTTSKGIVQIGPNIEVAAGVISVPNASATTPGVVKIGPGLTIDADGVTISADIQEIDTATETVPGTIMPGIGLEVITAAGPTKGTLNLLVPTASEIGGVKAGTGVSIDANGVISIVPYVLPAMTTTTLGGAKVGTGLQMNTVNSDVLEVSAILQAFNSGDAEKLQALPTAANIVQSITFIGSDGVSNTYTPNASGEAELPRIATLKADGTLDESVMPSTIQWQDVIGVANYSALDDLREANTGGARESVIYFLKADEVFGGVQYRMKDTFLYNAAGDVFIQTNTALAFASSAEAIAGVINDKVMSPNTTAEAINNAMDKTRFSVDLSDLTAIGDGVVSPAPDGVATVFTITHALGSKNIIVQVRDNNGEQMLIANGADGVNTLKLYFHENITPTTGQHVYVNIIKCD